MNVERPNRTYNRGLAAGVVSSFLTEDLAVVFLPTGLGWLLENFHPRKKFLSWIYFTSYRM